MKTIYKSELEKSGYYPDVIDALVKIATLNKEECSVEAFFYKGKWHSHVAAEYLKRVAYSLIGIIEGLSTIDSFPCEACVYADQYIRSELNKESLSHTINVLDGCNETYEEEMRRIATIYIILLLEVNISWNATYTEDSEDFSIDIVG